MVPQLHLGTLILVLPLMSHQMLLIFLSHMEFLLMAVSQLAMDRLYQLLKQVKASSLHLLALLICPIFFMFLSSHIIFCQFINLSLIITALLLLILMAMSFRTKPHTKYFIRVPVTRASTPFFLLLTLLKFCSVFLLQLLFGIED